MNKVSVIIPNYNYQLFLRKRIDSVLNQSYSNIEIIICDDGSTDDSMQIITMYSNHPRVKIIEYTHNSGHPYRRWNDGASFATGDYLLFAGADDYCDSTLIERLLDPFLSYPSLGLSYCQSYDIDESDQVMGTWLPWTKNFIPNIWESDFYLKGSEACKFMIRKNIIPNASAVLIPTHIFKAIGGFNEKYRLCSDWDLYIKILQQYDLYFLHEPLNFFRQHRNTVRQEARDKGIHQEEFFHIINDNKRIIRKSTHHLMELLFITNRFYNFILKYRSSLSVKRCLYNLWLLLHTDPLITLPLIYRCPPFLKRLIFDK